MTVVLTIVDIVIPFLPDVFLVYDKKWYLKNNKVIYEIDISKFEVKMMLVAYLTNEKSVYDERISTVDDKALASFPTKEIIESGFLQKTTYWIGLSIEWLNKADSSLFKYFESQVGDVVNDKRFTQKTRQIARNLLNKRIK